MGILLDGSGNLAAKLQVDELTHHLLLMAQCPSHIFCAGLASLRARLGPTAGFFGLATAWHPSLSSPTARGTQGVLLSCAAQLMTCHVFPPPDSPEDPNRPAYLRP